MPSRANEREYLAALERITAVRSSGYMKLQDSIGRVVTLDVVEQRRDPRRLWMRRVRRPVEGLFAVRQATFGGEGLRVELEDATSVLKRAKID